MDTARTPVSPWRRHLSPDPTDPTVLARSDEPEDDEWDDELDEDLDDDSDDEIDDDDWDEDDWDDDEEWDDEEEEEADDDEEDELWDDEPLLETRFIGRISGEEEELPRRPRNVSERGAPKRAGRPGRRPRPIRDLDTDRSDDDAVD